jgi:hypothetical protein
MKTKWIITTIVVIISLSIIFFLLKDKLSYWYHAKQLEKTDYDIDTCVYLCNCPNWGVCNDTCKSVVEKLKITNCPYEISL